jgi:hypothetical protein
MLASKTDGTLSRQASVLRRSAHLGRSQSTATFDNNPSGTVARVLNNELLAASTNHVTRRHKVIHLLLLKVLRDTHFGKSDWSNTARY